MTEEITTPLDQIHSLFKQIHGACESMGAGDDVLFIRLRAKDGMDIVTRMERVAEEKAERMA